MILAGRGNGTNQDLGGMEMSRREGQKKKKNISVRVPLLGAIALYTNLKMDEEFEHSCAIDLYPASKIIHKIYFIELVKVVYILYSWS